MISAAVDPDRSRDQHDSAAMLSAYPTCSICESDHISGSRRSTLPATRSRNAGLAWSTRPFNADHHRQGVRVSLVGVPPPRALRIGCSPAASMWAISSSGAATDWGNWSPVQRGTWSNLDDLQKQPVRERKILL